MLPLERRFLLEITMPMLNRDNVLFFVRVAYKKLSA